MNNKYIIYFFYLFIQNLVYGQESELKIKRPIEIEPTKITSGPHDNYQSMSHSNYKWPIYTSNIFLSPHIMIMDTNKKKPIHLVSEKFDSKEPSINSENIMSFTSFENNARGDICYGVLSNVGLSLTQNACIPSIETEDSQSFWIDDNTIGFVSNLITSKEESKIIYSYNIQSRQKNELLKGNYFYPTMHPDKTHLVSIQRYSEQENSQVIGIVIYNIKTKKQWNVHWNLPGISAHPKFSPDGTELYFTHYLYDVLNDQIIDAHSNGIIMKIKWKEILESNSISQELYPLPLTSGEMNCSFPNPTSKLLYITCSQDSNLDIYTLPLTGIIPTNWKEEQIDYAIRSARTPQTRIFYYNTIIARKKKYFDKKIFEKLTSNYLSLKSQSTADFYIQKLLENTNDFKDRQFYKILLSHENNIPNDEFKDFSILLQQKNLFETKKIIPKQLTFNPKNFTYPLMFFYYQDFINKIPLSIDKLAEYSKVIWDSNLLNNENKLYQAHFVAMKLLKSQSINEKTLDNLILIKDKATQIYFKAMKIMYTVKQTNDSNNFKQVQKILADNNTNYFLIRNILFLGLEFFKDDLNSKNTSLMDLISRIWTRFAKLEDTEYKMALELFTINSLDSAYKGFYPSNFFYSTIMLTDDQQAHIGYIQSSAHLDLKNIYLDLKNRDIIKDNIHLLDFFLLLENRPINTPEQLEKLFLSFRPLENLNDQILTEFFHGILYLYKIILSPDSNQVQEWADRSNQYFQEALEKNKYRKRVKISILKNLGLLHYLLKNYALAVKYFDQIDQNNIQLKFLYAHCIFHLQNYSQSIIIINELEKSYFTKIKDPQEQLYFLSFKAMNYLALQNHQKSIEIYEQILDPENNYNALNNSSLLLSYGYSLYKEKLFNSAYRVLTSINTNNNIVANYRTESLKYGLLAQISKNNQKFQYLEMQIGALEKILKDSDKYPHSKDFIYESLMKNYYILYHNNKNTQSYLQNALRYAELLIDQTGNAMNYGLFQIAKRTYQSEDAENFIKKYTAGLNQIAKLDKQAKIRLDQILAID